MPDPKRQFRILFRDVLSRVIDPELLPAGGDSSRLLIQLAALLAAFSLALSMMTLNQFAFSKAPPAALAKAVSSEVEFLAATTMAAAAILMLLAWNSVFPDKRDGFILGVLPVRPRTVFAARLCAIGAVLAAAVVSANVFTGLAIPFLISDGFGSAMRAFAFYWTAMAAAGLFTAASLVAVQGVAAAALPYRQFQRISGLIQFTAFFAIAAAYLLRPSAAEAPLAVARIVPSFWFYGLYLTMTGGASAAGRTLAAQALAGLAAAVAISAIAFARAYRRSLSGVVEQPDIAPGEGTRAAGRMLSSVLARMSRHPLHRAIAGFAALTVARSRQHRLLLAIYGGAGFAFALYFLRDVVRGRYTTELWSMVGSPIVRVQWDQPSIPLLAAVFILLVFAITGVRAAFVFPIAPRANWIFRFASRGEDARCFAASRNALYLLAAVPVWCLAAILYFALWPVDDAVYHLLFLIAESVLMVEAAMRGFAKIPFTCTYQPGAGNLDLKAGIYALVFLIAADRGAAIEMWASGGAARGAIVMGLLAALAAIARYRASRTPLAPGYRILFDDAPQPAVSAFSLTAAAPPPVRTKDDELQEELRFHLRMAERERLAEGLPSFEARRGAALELGNVTRIREEVREVWRAATLDSFLNDLRIAFRSLAKAPAFSVTALLLIGLGIGVNGSVFSLFQAIMHRPMTGVQADRLVSLGIAIDGREQDPGDSWANYQDYAAATRTLRRIMARGFARLAVGTGQASYAMRAALVTRDYFDTLGVKLPMGRAFLDGPQLSAVISEQAWREQFDSDPRVIGRAITVNGHPATVAGVAPAGFRGVQLAERNDVYLPIVEYWLADGRKREFTDHGWGSVELLGLLSDGSTMADAQAELTVISERLERAHPRENRGKRLLVEPYTAIGPGVSPVRIALKVLLAVAAVLLVVVSANVANLVLCRSIRRQHELAIRKSLGAPLARVFSLLFAEGLLLSLAAAGVGWWAAVWGPPAVLHFVPGPLPALDLSPDRSLAAYVVALAVFMTLTFTVAPAIGAWRQDPLGALKSRDVTMPSRRRAMTVLSVVQLALSFILMTGAGLLERSASAFHSFDPGFKKEGLLFVNVNTASAAASPEANARQLEALRSSLLAQPGVAYAPLSWAGASIGRIQNEASGVAIRADYNTVGPDYFATLGAPLLAGRDIALSDRAGSPRTAVVNERVAGALWPGQNPVGRRFHVQNSGADIEVVGVVGNGAFSDFRQRDAAYLVFLPHAQAEARPGETPLHLRLAGDPGLAAAAVREAIRQTNSLIAMGAVTTVDDRMQNMFPARLFAFLFGLFAAGALLLAAVGLYTIVALEMARRTREFAVRIALGASGRRVWFEAMRGGFVLIAAGSAFGLAISLAGARGMRSALFGISALDPATYFGVVLVLACACTAACAAPVLRATRTDPASVLREE